MDTTGPASPPALQGSHLRTAILSPPVPYMPIQELSQANSIVIPECGRLVLPAQLPPYDDGPCVWFAAIPPPLTKSNLASVCAHFGTVKALIFPPAPSIDKALMIFKTPREATLCCHTLLANLTAANAGRRMCATIPGAHNPPTEEPLGTCIWFGGSCGVATEAELQRALSAAGLPNPRHIIRVTGTTPGLIFELQSISFVPRSLQCLMPVAQEGDRQPPPATTPAPWPTRASGAESMALPPHLLPPPEPSPMDIAAPTVPPPHPPPPPWHQTVDLQRAPSGPSTSSLPEALPRPPIAPPSAPPPPLPPPDQPPPPPPPPPPYSQPPLPDSSPPPPPPPPTNPKVEHPEPPSRRRTTRFSDLPAAEGRSVGPAVASPAGGTLGPPWVGHLAKSGMNLCKVLCSAKPKVSDGGLEGQEPLGWPTVLDVRIRVDLSSVLKQMFQSFTPDKRAIRRLMPVSAASDKGPLLDFVKYLTTRSRAGVVHLDKKEGVGPRTLYLIPPSKQNCELMGVGWEPKESVIVLVVSGEGGKRA
ncbi:unnamed protein product [Ostreobium quekettii]|uniref:Spen paralogue and orthologue SPOC C-terminal domain-containing protein n=1 Tax=Ostreobium quekettii TaxID=121088 RepID=A0A8S1J9N2_9CHLO|nr:unnamed protein product [Ostreobium quekettii]